MSDFTELFQEGLLFTHQRLYAESPPVTDLFDFITANVRFPDLVRGDLDAQIAACRQGMHGVTALCNKYGIETVKRSMDIIIERTAAAMRKEIAAVPDGIDSDHVELDHDGVERQKPRRIAIQLRVHGNRVAVSFEGTSEEVTGPINCPAIGTRSRVRAAFKGLLAPLDPSNEGHFQMLDSHSLPGLVVNPNRPSPCDSLGYVGVCLMELTQFAMAPAMPDRTLAQALTS